MFIHIPKTGGHSVWNVMRANGGHRCKDTLGGNWTHHMSATGIRQKMGSTDYDRYDKVALIRNPWQRAVGLYFGRNKIKEHSPAGFAKFMKQYRGIGKYRWNPFYPQSRLLLPDVRAFKLEHIDELYRYLEQACGIEVNGPDAIKTGRNRHVERLPWREYFTDALRDEIARKHERDIERWGWVF